MRIIGGVVNSDSVRASTWVMAAGTALKAITMPTAEDIAAEEVSRVVERHRPQIFRFLLSSTRDVDLAETLTQECFLKAHRNWGSFRGESSAMTWLTVEAVSAVSVLVMDWTTIGWSPPTQTSPILTGTEVRRGSAAIKPP